MVGRDAERGGGCVGEKTTGLRERISCATTMAQLIFRDQNYVTINFVERESCLLVLNSVTSTPSVYTCDVTA